MLIMKKGLLLASLSAISFIFLMLILVSTLTPPAPSIIITSPNGGEKWQWGSSQQIKWQTSSESAAFDVYYVSATLGTEYTTIKNISGQTTLAVIAGLLYIEKDGSKIYLPVDSYKVKICISGTDLCDSSDNSFIITNLPISCKEPDCEGRYDTGKIDENGCVIYACPSKCEDYSYNQCPSWCEEKTVCIAPTIAIPCKEGETCSKSPSAPCQLICSTPGKKEVYLNQKFELKSGETAEVVNYKNMVIKHQGMSCISKSCPENEPCPPTPTLCRLTLQVSVPFSGITETTADAGSSSTPETSASMTAQAIQDSAATTDAPRPIAKDPTVSTSPDDGSGSGGSGVGGRTQPDGMVTILNIIPGEKKEVFGATISLLRLNSNVAVLLVEERIIIKPICGNGICEVGEGEVCRTVDKYVFCGDGKECTVPAPVCKFTCLQDCEKYDTIFVPLGEKFKLQISQTGIVKEDNLKITFKNMIASQCEETVVSSQASASAIKEKVEEAEMKLTGSVVSNLGDSKPVSVLRCTGKGPKALLSFEIERVKGNPIKKGVLELDLSEKKQIGEFTLAFLDYDYASRTGVFLVDKEKFICPARCKCDIEGNSIDCQDKKICEERKILCPDGECRDKCEIKPSEEECNFGCNYEGSCFPMGVRSKELYCGTDSVMNSQKDNEQICENNFECSSNVCISGKCISKGFIDKILDFFRRIFGAG